MKEIKAYIKPFKLDAVCAALHKVEGLTGISVAAVRGFGRSKTHRVDLENEEAHIKVEIVCADELVEEVIAAIQGAAHTGLRGDGKVYVMPVEQAVRIETGQRDEA